MSEIWYDKRTHPHPAWWGYCCHFPCDRYKFADYDQWSFATEHAHSWSQEKWYCYLVLENVSIFMSVEKLITVLCTYPVVSRIAFSPLWSYSEVMAILAYFIRFWSTDWYIGEQTGVESPVPIMRGNSCFIISVRHAGMFCTCYNRQLVLFTIHLIYQDSSVCLLSDIVRNESSVRIENTCCRLRHCSACTDSSGSMRRSSIGKFVYSDTQDRELA